MILINLLVLYKYPMILVIYLAFYIEYFYFINYFINLFRNWNDYYVISLKYVDISDFNIFELWLEYSKAMAFSRLYLLLLKKQASVYNMLFSLIILILGIPFKILVFSYRLMNKNKGFRDALIEMYFDIYYLHRYNKIEILNGKIYMNCFSLKTLIMCANLKNKSPETYYNFVRDIKAFCNKWDINDKDRLNKIEFILSEINLKENKVLKPHYTKIIDNFSIHCTSRIPKLENSQVLTNAMPSGIKEGSKDPGTILSLEVRGYKKFKSSIWIPEIEIKSALHDIIDIYDLPISRCQYIHEKDLELQEIMLKHTKYSELSGRKLRGEIRGGNYNYILDNTNEVDIWKEISECMVSHNINE